jgi:ADP-heptose:LPS heptosyltransferase
MKTLVYHTGALGDFITVLPALCLWKQKYPETAINLIGKPAYYSLVKNQSLIDDVTDIDSAAAAPLFTESTPLPFHLKSKLTNIDTALLFTNPESPVVLHCRQLGIPDIRVQPPFPERQIHIIDYHFELVPECVSDRSNVNPLVIPDKAKLLFNMSAMNNSRYAVIHPGSGSKIKNWPVDRFNKLSQILKDKTGFKTVWIIGPAEEPLIVNHSDVMLNDCSLEEIAPVLAGASLYIGNDSGISHLAAACGCPCVVLFGPSDPAVWAPRGKTVSIISRHKQCSPCHGLNKGLCSSNQSCIEEIQVEDVLAECLRT